MKQPLAPAALAFATGIAVSEWQPLPLFCFLAAGLLSLLAATLFPSQRPLLLLLAIVLAGASWAVAQLESSSPIDIRNATPRVPAIVTLHGTLEDTPAVRITVRDGTPRERTVVPLRLTAVVQDEVRSPAAGTVLITTAGRLPGAFFRSQRVEVTGVLQLPRPADTEGLFDYREFLRHQGIHRQLVAGDASDWRLPPDASSNPPLSERFLPWARKVLARGLPPNDSSVELLWAMTLGWKTALTDEVEEPFMRSGTMHVFAISGLHIALISTVIVALLRLFRLGRPTCGAATIPLTWFYVAATGWQPSAIRSAVMMTVIVGGWALRRPGNLPNSLAGAALAILVWQPGQLFLPGFQLSFGVVGSMALLGTLLHAFWSDRVRFDPLVPDELRPRWQRWLSTLLDWLGLNLSTALSAWLGSLPLVWQYFHIVNPVSLLANLVVVPLSSAALIANLASLLCGDWLPGLGQIFNASAWVWMTWMTRASSWFASLPGGSWNVEALPTLLWVPYYLGLLILGSSRATPWKPSAWKAIGAFATWVALAAAVSCGRDSRVRLVLAPGGTAWLDAPQANEDLLLDCGDESATKFFTLPLLRARGVDELPRLAISHSDTRHAGGAPALFESLLPQQISLPGGRFRSPADRRLREEVQRRNLPLQSLARGDQIGPWCVLHPDEDDQYRNADDQALVLMGEFNGLRILLCSDLGRTGQGALLERGAEELRADILVTGVPGASEPVCDAFLEAAKPRLLIVNSGAFPVQRRVGPATRERLARQPIPVWYQQDCGVVTLEQERSGWIARSWTQPETLRLWVGRGQ